MVNYDVYVVFVGLSTAQNSICTTSDLDRSPLTDTRSAENDRIGDDTDPEYRIDASLVLSHNSITSLAHPRHRPPPSFRFCYSNKIILFSYRTLQLKLNAATQCSAPNERESARLYHSSLGLHCPGCPDQIYCYLKKKVQICKITWMTQY